MIAPAPARRPDGRVPGLSAPVAALGLGAYGFAVGFSSHLLANAWGTFPALVLLASGTTLGFMVIVAGSRGLYR